MKGKVILRRVSALGIALLTLWTVAVTVGSRSLHEAAENIRTLSPAQQLVRWELGDLLPRRNLSLAALMTLYQSPVLRLNQSFISPSPEADPAPGDASDTESQWLPPPVESPAENTDPVSPEPSTPVTPPETDLAEGLTFADNGVRSETVQPSSPSGYTVAGDVYIRNRSDKTLDAEDLSGGQFAAVYGDSAPQVLIYHTHGSEAYTLPQGQTYHSTGTYRTDDASVSVVRVGDEIAAVLSSYGISVLHDRTLYDDPAYNGAYVRSGAAAESYLAKYPSLTYVLDIHRDAVQDSSGQQYKLISREDPRAAQISLIMGVNHEGWEENLKLATAIQRTVQSSRPTLMRPIFLLNANYNQNLSRGAMLVEVGAAGNSLDEAIYAGRLFAKGFAETVLASRNSG
ncbi:MAG: stage II sporulation protein P [Oscillospiraceae bacterium]|nr:stage II sporulation protein P [Oscillospiraceae bacterium]